jgi:hypothetical protein
VPLSRPLVLHKEEASFLSFHLTFLGNYFLCNPFLPRDLPSSSFTLHSTGSSPSTPFDRKKDIIFSWATSGRTSLLRSSRTPTHVQALLATPPFSFPSLPPSFSFQLVPSFLILYPNFFHHHFNCLSADRSTFFSFSSYLTSLTHYGSLRNEKLLADPVRLRQISDRIPAGRWGEPRDFAGPIVFLASAASQYVCGELLVVDGVS